VLFSTELENVADSQFLRAAKLLFVLNVNVS